MKVIKAEGYISTSYILIADFHQYKEMVKELKIKYVYFFSDVDKLTLNNMVRDPGLRRVHSTFQGQQAKDKNCFGFSENGTWFLCSSNGFTSFEEYDDAVSIGCKNNLDYKTVKNGGFDNYTDYIETRQKGFISKGELLEAKNIGCENKDEYTSIKNAGFLNKEEYLEAENIGAKTKKEFLEYQDFENNMKGNNLETHDEVLLYRYFVENIHSLNIESLSINRILSQVNRNVLARSPKWYKSGIKNYEFFEKYIIENKSADEYFYNKIVDRFQEKPISFSNTEIVLDGNNIAWNNGSSELGDKPLIRNVIFVTKDLINRGFISIRIYFDANIEYDIDDKQVYKQLENTFNIKKVPTGEKADKHILEYAKANRTYVISNDKYTEYANLDKWFEKNLEKIKVQFTIEGDKVIYNKKIEK